MSCWTYITGTINVDVPGRTQPEIEYILKTIMDHLPVVTGSERDMEVYLNRVEGDNCSSSHDEYEMWTNNLTDGYGDKNRKGGWLRTQSQYLITVNASLRDRMFEQTFREFMKWLCRLSKRINIDSIFVKIKGCDNSDNDREYIINEEGYKSPYDKMYEMPSWSSKTGEPCWWEHLMWKRFDDCPLPINHVVKYYDCEEADKEFEKINNKVLN